LHATQVDDAGTTLFLVTQSPGGRTCLATAMEAYTGRIKWQRQLGFIGQGGLMQLGSRLLGLDQGGGLCEFDPAKLPPQQDLAWQTLANNWVIKPDLARVPRTAYLLPAGDDSALVIFSTSKGDELVVRRYQAGADGKSGTVHEYPVNWMERKGVSLAGAPAVRGDSVLLPLDNGVVLRLGLSGEDKATQQEGPTWRASNASPTARAFVAWINDEEFVTSNGGTGLTRWRWPIGGTGYTATPAEGEANNPSLMLDAPLAAAPIVLPLPTPQNKDALGLCLADENGKVTLNQIQPDSFNLVRSWPLGAKVTAGPFLRGSSIGCVVDQNVLVWLNSTSNKQWTYATARAPLVGEPQLVDNSLLVADQTGLIQALDPKTGKPRNAGYRLKTIAGPAASPAPFGAGRAMVPLTDGTLFLLPLERLGQAPAKSSVPIFSPP
jgi:hypothetical protein